jgi:hypothetical protein
MPKIRVTSEDAVAQQVKVKLAITVEFMASLRFEATARVAGIPAMLFNHLEHGDPGAGPTGVTSGSVKVDITKQEITETS